MSDKSVVLDGLRYSKDHEWVKPAGVTVTAKLSLDGAQGLTGHGGLLARVVLANAAPAAW